MINRETVRDRMVQDLSAIMVDQEGAAREVVGYRVWGPEGSPVVAVFAAGSDRPPLTNVGSSSEFDFMVEAWTRADADGMTAAEVEDRVDLLEKLVADYVSDNRVLEGFWRDLRYTQKSQVTDLPVEGKVYIVENIYLTVRVAG
jgi:hypothetical protein